MHVGTFAMGALGAFGYPHGVVRRVRKPEPIPAPVIEHELNQVVILLAHSVPVFVKDKLFFGFIPKI